MRYSAEILGGGGLSYLKCSSPKDSTNWQHCSVASQDQKTDPLNRLIKESYGSRIVDTRKHTKRQEGQVVEEGVLAMLPSKASAGESCPGKSLAASQKDRRGRTGVQSFVSETLFV